jgi:hypothetical protein
VAGESQLVVYSMGLTLQQIKAGKMKDKKLRDTIGRK